MGEGGKKGQKGWGRFEFFVVFFSLMVCDPPPAA